MAGNIENTNKNKYLSVRRRSDASCCLNLPDVFRRDRLSLSDDRRLSGVRLDCAKHPNLADRVARRLHDCRSHCRGFPHGEAQAGARVAVEAPQRPGAAARRRGAVAWALRAAPFAVPLAVAKRAELAAPPGCVAFRAAPLAVPAAVMCAESAAPSG